MDLNISLKTQLCRPTKIGVMVIIYNRKTNEYETYQL